MRPDDIPSRTTYVPPPPPPPPPPPARIETAEDAIAQANHDHGGDLHGTSHAQTRENLAESRETAISAAIADGRNGDVATIDDAFDQAQARLDAADVAWREKPEAPVGVRTDRTPDGGASREATYADGTRIVQVDGRDAAGHPVTTVQVFRPGEGDAAARVPLESRSVVVNGVSTTSGLPERVVEQMPDGRTVVTDAYGVEAGEAARLVQHTVLPRGDGGWQVQSVTLREHAGAPAALRIREVDADGSVAFDTGEVSGTTVTPVAGRPGVTTVVHEYDSGMRMQSTVHAAPAGSEGVPDALLAQSLETADGAVVFETSGATRTVTADGAGGQRVVDTAVDGSRTERVLAADGTLTQLRAYDAAGSLRQTVVRETVDGLPVVASRETTTGADGRQVVVEYDADGQPVGIRRTDADGRVTEVAGSLDGERIDASRADEIARGILDVGDRRLWRDDYEARLEYALETMQPLDPASQQLVLSALQEQDPGMGDSWFRTGILENLDADALSRLESGGLDILTGIQGTTAADLEAVRQIHELDVDAGAITGEYGELAATMEEQDAGQLQAFVREYQARAGDPQAQARFVALYERMHGEAFVEGFLSDERLLQARDEGLDLYRQTDTVGIDRGTYEALMGLRLESAADRRPEVLAARDRVMDAGVRRFMVDNQEQRVQALVEELSALDPEGQAALVRQVVKEDPDARLNWLRDSIIDRATEDNEAFTPEMRALVTQLRGNGETSFLGQLQGFGGGLKDAGVGFVVGLGTLVRTGYDLGLGGVIVDQVSGGNAPAWLPSAKRGAETATAMVEGLPRMFDHIGAAWNDGRYGEALGNITFDVASMLIPVKIPKIRLPGAGAVDNVAGAADDLAGGARYIDAAGRPLDAPAIEPRLATQGPDGVYTITDAPSPRLGIDGPVARPALDAAATPEVIAQRQATAAAYYERATGRVDPSHLDGIDFSRPVEVQTLREGTIVYQWQAPGAPQGSYFSPSASARPTDIGISSVGVPPHIYSRVSEYLRGLDPDTPGAVRNADGTYSGMDPAYALEIAPSGIVDKVPVAYRVTADVDVLVSTARAIDDTWALPDRSMTAIPTEGGRLQIYTGDRHLFEPVSRSADPPSGPPPLPAAPGGAVPPGRTFADDVLGTAPHRLDRDFMQIAGHVYRADGSPPGGSFRQVAEADLPPGFSPADFEHASGLRAALYTNGDGQFVLAFKGTAPISRTGLKDIYTDAAQGLGFPTAQYAHAVDLTRRAYAHYGDNLVLTGHSLGGGLASQAAMAVGAGHLPAVVFNPAAVHPRNLARENPLFDNAGVVQHAPDGGSFANGAELAPYFAGEGGLIRAYIVRNDELTLFQDHVPGIPGALGHREGLPGNVPIGHTMGPVQNSFDKRFPDGVTSPPADEGLWYLDPGTGWTTQAPDG